MASLQDGFEEPGDVQDIRLVVDTIPTLAWSTRPGGSADLFNQRWLDYTGLSAEQALDWGWKVAIYPDDVPRILETFREALNTVKPFEVEGRFRRFDGEFATEEGSAGRSAHTLYVRGSFRNEASAARSAGIANRNTRYPDLHKIALTIYSATYILGKPCLSVPPSCSYPRRLARGPIAHSQPASPRD